jgi:hypothetical protein
VSYGTTRKHHSQTPPVSLEQVCLHLYRAATTGETNTFVSVTHQIFRQLHRDGVPWGHSFHIVVILCRNKQKRRLNNRTVKARRVKRHHDEKPLPNFAKSNNDKRHKYFRQRGPSDLQTFTSRPFAVGDASSHIAVILCSTKQRRHSSQRMSGTGGLNGTTTKNSCRTHPFFVFVLACLD